jgi:hypothetical protein
VKTQFKCEFCAYQGDSAEEMSHHEDEHRAADGMKITATRQHIQPGTRRYGAPAYITTEWSHAGRLHRADYNLCAVERIDESA